MFVCCTMSSHPPKNNRHWRNFPISKTGDRSTTAPNKSQPIYLEGGNTMYTQSNILASHAYTIPLSLLTSYDDSGFDNRICKESYGFLMKELGLLEEQWIPTEILEGNPTAAPPTPPISPFNSPTKSPSTSPWIPTSILKGNTVAAPQTPPISPINSPNKSLSTSPPWKARAQSASLQRHNGNHRPSRSTTGCSRTTKIPEGSWIHASAIASKA